MRRRDGTPVWVSQTRTALMQRADLGSGANGTNYDEAWLQNLLHCNPEVFPTEQIEPGFGRLIPICRELPVTFGAGRSGALDNIFTTADGRLVLIEAKLWRNPEARRSVVAQAMEYAAAIFRLSYESFEQAIKRANRTEGQEGSSLFAIVQKHEPHVDEAEFIDAVSLNLKRGRAIVAVVGDGIREDLEPLAELLQSHAGHRFTFALVELAIFETPEQTARIVVPSVLAKTALIERGVVQILDDNNDTKRISITPNPTTPQASSTSRQMGIGEDEFYELIDQRSAGTSVIIKNFLAKADAIGIRAERQSGLNLKHPSPRGNPLNLGTIDKSGFVDTSPSTWWGRTALGRTYNDTMARLIGGFVRDMKNGEESAVRTAAGKTPRITDFLPQHEGAWLDAISQYTQASFAEDEHNN